MLIEGFLLSVSELKANSCSVYVVHLLFYPFVFEPMLSTLPLC